jgi:hypothetical protein
MMPEVPKPRIDPAIVAALIGLAGTITVALISVFVNRSVAPQPTVVPVNTVGVVLELPTSSTGAQATESPIATTPGAMPTVKYPNGKPFKLFYDENSFYLLNRSNATIPINRVAFERLSDNDVPLNRFNGTRWAEFYAYSTPNKCVALEILGSPPYLSPPECGRNTYLSLRTPTREDTTVFWTAQAGSHQFRVLWREGGGAGEEIARCEIDAGVCEVFLP